MGISKTEFYTENQNKTALLFKALGHPARIAIIDYLLKVDSCICGQIVNEIPLAQPTISQHLKELKNVGLIQGSVEGNAICYCINQETMADLLGYVSLINNKLNQKKCC